MSFVNRLWCYRSYGSRPREYERAVVVDAEVYARTASKQTLRVFFSDATNSYKTGLVQTS